MILCTYISWRKTLLNHVILILILSCWLRSGWISFTHSFKSNQCFTNNTIDHNNSELHELAKIAFYGCCRWNGLLPYSRNRNQKLNKQISGLWEPARDFAHAKIPQMNVSNLCSIVSINEQYQLYVVTPGMFYNYAINKEGGECRLLKTESMIIEEE